MNCDYSCIAVGIAACDSSDKSKQVEEIRRSNFTFGKRPLHLIGQRLSKAFCQALFKSGQNVLVWRWLFYSPAELVSETVFLKSQRMQSVCFIFWNAVGLTQTVGFLSVSVALTVVTVTRVTGAHNSAKMVSALLLTGGARTHIII